MDRWIIGPSHTIGIVRSNFGILYGVLRSRFFYFDNLISVQLIFWPILMQKRKYHRCPQTEEATSNAQALKTRKTRHDKLTLERVDLVGSNKRTN